MENQNSIQIADRLIGTQHRPFIIAELSGNHNQSLARALELVEAAAKTGADAIKLQTYTANSLTIDCDRPEFKIADEKSLWKGRTLYSLYQEAATPYDWHKPIFDRCKELGLICFSTPFDEEAVDFLEALDSPCYKLASFEITHLPLVAKIAKTRKPLIASTGMASPIEIQEMVDCARENGCPEIVLLKCTSSYPAEPLDSNILTIPHMRDLFKTQVGLSDHTMGVGVAVASIALGATVIEKHFTLARADGGVDSAFSLEPQEFSLLVTEALRAWQALGSVTYNGTESESKSRLFRRSVYAVKDIKRGERFSAENIRVIRPSLGVAPRFYTKLVGTVSERDIARGTPITPVDILRFL
ncbi:MAG: pseudaminic acid synthase [Proteobacteria bacterium]|nr:pseudaminic acid synthase [Pseudomonadota bacterium]NDC25407.1 pseudaminic acid synthase [Pseudomonadota bacterium]NDD03333.1 pseudaminic acid synthase [Pseudomonadota bacterium]NDG25725.1 pseudaminic acid synthase [Pseudomonadota bacterium]